MNNAQELALNILQGVKIVCLNPEAIPVMESKVKDMIIRQSNK